HPRTGTTTSHTYPYSALPRFAPLADAGLLTLTAEAFLVNAYAEDPLFTELNDLWEANEIYEHVRLFEQPPPAPTLPKTSFPKEAQAIRTSKRKQADEDPSRPTKRTRRAAPSQPPKRSSQSAAPSKASGVARSSPPPFQDHLDHYTPTPPKRKRVDTQPQDCPQVKRAKESPCMGPSPARTVYARSSKAKGMAKTEAILRPGRVR
ncbi:hypothetical protein CYLTODRAFT_459680, partial [Cylindrobasidium torrendii FP15055 ss-10]